jgi:hypothetical protein
MPTAIMSGGVPFFTVSEITEITEKDY